MTTAIKLDRNMLGCLGKFKLEHTCKQLGIKLGEEPEQPAKYVCYKATDNRIRFVTYELPSTYTDVSTPTYFIVKLNQLYIRKHQVDAAIKKANLEPAFDKAVLTRAINICCDIEHSIQNIRKRYSDKSVRPVSTCVRAIIDAMQT